MKPRIRKVIKYDYLSSFLFVIALITTLLFIAIIFSGVEGVLGIITPVFILSIALLVVRVIMTRNEIARLKNSRVIGTVQHIDSYPGRAYVVVNYDVNSRNLGKRIPVMAGPILKVKLGKMKEVQLLVDINKPKKVFIEELFY